MKNARHEQILLLIEKYEIETQEELAERLNQAGFTVTQATVSRDIRQLQLRKIPSSAEHAGNIVVIRTVSGMAMAAAAAIDSLDWREVLGCIAGDDTIMVVVRTPDSAPEIIGRIRSIARTAH